MSVTRLSLLNSYDEKKDSLIDVIFGETVFGNVVIQNDVQNVKFT